MKILITAPTMIKGVDVSPGDVREVGNNDAYTLIECRKATRDPARIAARETEMSSAEKPAEPATVEQATAKPVAETSARRRPAAKPAPAAEPTA